MQQEDRQRTQHVHASHGRREDPGDLADPLNPTNDDERDHKGRDRATDPDRKTEVRVQHVGHGIRLEGVASQRMRRWP
jgi:hypothetical protein